MKVRSSSSRYQWWLVSLLCVGLYAVEAQKCRTYPQTEFIQLDSIVDPRSIQLPEGYSYSWEGSGQIRLQSSLEADSISICYHTLSPKLNESFYYRDIRTYSAGERQRAARAAVTTPSPSIFNFGNMYTNGAISRGVTVGNRQNVFVNSSLNLQMEGQLTEDLMISAVITDQNIPYQPEGNTQQLRDFDNVYIKLYQEQFELVAGDVVLQNPVPQGYFLKYYKNVQGISGSIGYQLSNDWQARTQVSGALSKGQFHSTTVTPFEGVQGPYKLRGPNGERFIIVLANSEKVYLDGKLLKRGFDFDYVMDYNLGEITFSNQVVITRFSRIRIDYEYSEQYYQRSNVTAAQTFSRGGSTVYLNYYREKDNRTAAFGFEPSEEDLNTLESAGDANGLVLINSADSVDYQSEAILYARKDTLNLDGVVESIYYRSFDPDSARFNINFTEVGPGMGDYVILQNTSNGKAFRWVSPEGGQSQGQYAPVRAIPTPNQKQLIVGGIVQQLGQHEVVQIETALSNQDLNLYSNLDDTDNSGLALKASVQTKGRKLPGLSVYELVALLDFEWDQQTFTFIDRFRSADYDWQWGYDIFSDSVNRSDQIINAKVSLIKSPSDQFTYQFSHRNREGVVSGFQHTANLRQQLGWFSFDSRNYWMKNQPQAIASEWYRGVQTIQLSAFDWKPGYSFRMDQHQRIQVATDSVQATQMHFQAHNVFLIHGDTTGQSLRLDYVYRTDQLPIAGRFEDYTKAQEYKLSYNTLFAGNQRLTLALNYRTVDDLQNDSGSNENILGRANWNGSFWDGLIRQSFNYSTANTRELKRDYVFVNVATGEGTHTWRDENNDGAQDLNEFYEAINQDEKNYIKLFTPTDEYLTGYQTTYFQTLDIQSPFDGKHSSGRPGVLAALSYNLNMRYHFKTTDTGLNDRLNPFVMSLDNDAVLFARNLTRHTLFYNRNAPGIGFDLSRLDQSSKSLLSNGSEQNRSYDWQLISRIPFNKMLTWRFTLNRGETSHSSDFLLTRNFSLVKSALATEGIWQPHKALRLVGGFERRINATPESALSNQSDINEYRFELYWIHTGMGSLNAQLSWLNIDFEGVANSYLGYEMLEALQPGTNQKWQLNWQQTLGGGLQMTLQYHGRKSTGNEAIHTGMVQLTAYF